MKVVGFFGGSFDPIHFGHINLAIELMEKCALDKVLFCPAFCSPFRGDHPPQTSPSHRLNMVRLGIEGIPQFSVLPCEVEQPGPSYTIDTIKALQKPGIQYHLLLSDESAAHFAQWKNASELLHLAPPLVGSRHHGHLEFDPNAKAIVTKIFEISSTEVRRRLHEGKPCSHLVPAKVLDYIQTHRLYSRS